MIATIHHLGIICNKEEEYKKMIISVLPKPEEERHQMYYEWLKKLAEEAGKIGNEKPGHYLFTILMGQAHELKKNQNRSCSIM